MLKLHSFLSLSLLSLSFTASATPAFPAPAEIWCPTQDGGVSLECSNVITAKGMVKVCTVGQTKNRTFVLIEPVSRESNTSYANTRVRFSIDRDFATLAIGNRFNARLELLGQKPLDLQCEYAAVQPPKFEEFKMP